jgi:hypothetical protein
MASTRPSRPKTRHDGHLAPSQIRRPIRWFFVKIDFDALQNTKIVYTRAHGRSCFQHARVLT